MSKKLIKELIFNEALSFNFNATVNNNKIVNSNINNSSNDCEDFHYKYSNDNFYYRGEIALWKAVILQAMVDLQSNSKKKIANTYRIKALMWFNLKNQDFLTVCCYAGLDPQYVHQRAIVIKEKNMFFM